MRVNPFDHQNKKAGQWIDPEGVVPPMSISDQIYELLKKKIMSGEIQPGERLMQEEVAQALNASRTPIRQAFRLLERDGLVERLPNSWVRVSRIDIETVEDVFGIRGALEAYGVEMACERIQPEAIDALKSISRQADHLLESDSIKREAKLRKLLELNSLFHETIYQSTRSRYLMDLINNLREVVIRLRALGLREHRTWGQVWDEHLQLIDCLERKDKRTAASLMRKHIAAAASYVVAAFQDEKQREPEERPQERKKWAK